jgi:hypothetical protein
MTAVNWSIFRRRSLHVWREVSVADGSGGFTILFVDQGSELFKVVQSSAEERLTSLQTSAEHTHNIFAEPDVDARRNDRLAPLGVNPNTAGGYYRVLAEVTDDAGSYDYAKWNVERVEAGP